MDNREPVPNDGQEEENSIQATPAQEEIYQQKLADYETEYQSALAGIEEIKNKYGMKEDNYQEKITKAKASYDRRVEQAKLMHENKNKEK